MARVANATLPNAKAVWARNVAEFRRRVTRESTMRADSDNLRPPIPPRVDLLHLLFYAMAASSDIFPATLV